MSSDLDTTSRPPMIALLNAALGSFSGELYRRMGASPYGDIRPGHGCVFGNTDPDGSRLTEIAERACMTKQSVAEVANDLEERGYLERVPDPEDGRAKIIRLTEKGRAAQSFGRGMIADIEREWAELYGEDHVAALRDALEAITAERFGAVPA